MYRLSQVIAHRYRHVGMQAEPRDAQLAREASLVRRAGRSPGILELGLLRPAAALWLAITGAPGAHADGVSHPRSVAERGSPAPKWSAARRTVRLLRNGGLTQCVSPVLLPTQSDGWLATCSGKALAIRLWAN
jgi:hypothetical protein